MNPALRLADDGLKIERLLHNAETVEAAGDMYDFLERREAVLRSDAPDHLRIAADHNELGAPALALHAGVGCKRRGERYGRHLRKVLRWERVNRAEDADLQVFGGCCRLGGKQDLAGVKVKKNGVRTGSAGVDS